jgi:hypothetical protein
MPPEMLDNINPFQENVYHPPDVLNQRVEAAFYILGCMHARQEFSAHQCLLGVVSNIV